MVLPPMYVPSAASKLSPVLVSTTKLIWARFAHPAEFLKFPAASFVRFFANHGLLKRKPDVSWRVVRGGSKRYVEALTAPFRDRIRTRTPVLAVERGEEHALVFTKGAPPERFDHVILALHSDQALAILGDDLGVVEPFEFEAQCRWVAHEEIDDPTTSGFHIVKISEEDQHRLQEFIRYVRDPDRGGAAVFAG